MNVSEILMKIEEDYGIDVNNAELGGLVIIAKHDGPENEFTATHIEVFENQMGSMDFNVKKETQYLSSEQVELKKAQEAQMQEIPTEINIDE